MKNKVFKSLSKMPVAEQKKFAALVIDLEADGPLQTSWPNFSKIGKNEFHCHLSYKWVACWKNENNSIIVEVYYAGSRENAPYRYSDTGRRI